MHEGVGRKCKKGEAFLTKIRNYDIKVYWVGGVHAFEEIVKWLKLVFRKACGICGHELGVKTMGGEERACSEQVAMQFLDG